jgi:hypothetical protein
MFEYYDGLGERSAEYLVAREKKRSDGWAGDQRVNMVLDGFEKAPRLMLMLWFALGRPIFPVPELLFVALSIGLEGGQCIQQLVIGMYGMEVINGQATAG